MRNSFDRQVARLNVTRSQWTMIAIVASQPGATQRVIAEALEMSEASAGRLVDRLCGEGLLQRKQCKHDRRAHAVHLTEAAKPLLDQLAAIASESEKRIFAGFSDQELDAFKDFLDRIYQNVSNGQADTGDSPSVVNISQCEREVLDA